MKQWVLWMVVHLNYIHTTQLYSIKTILSKQLRIKCLFKRSTYSEICEFQTQRSIKMFYNCQGPSALQVSNANKMFWALLWWENNIIFTGDCNIICSIITLWSCLILTDLSNTNDSKTYKPFSNKIGPKYFSLELNVTTHMWNIKLEVQNLMSSNWKYLWPVHFLSSSTYVAKY